MKITTVELGKFPQLMLIENFYHPAMKLEHPVESEPAKGRVMKAGVRWESAILTD